jgi:next-to-BRCA1 protein 1
MIERYSDSAAAFVMLDASNMAVYKQLYRAAKAKSKLKLRVCVLPRTEPSSPKPVSVEDAPEIIESPPTEITKPVEVTPIENPVPVNANPTPLETASSSRTTFTKQYDANLLQEAAKILRDHKADFDNRVKEVMMSNDKLASLTSQMANCQPFTTTSSVPKLSGPLSPVCPATGAAFAVCCNSCEQNIPDAHYHCSTCDDGDFDLCQSCVDRGITCYSDDHWLIKRIMNNGQIVNSTTETIAPKLKIKAAEKLQPVNVGEEPEHESFQPEVHEYQPTRAICCPSEIPCARPTNPTTNLTPHHRVAHVGNMRTCNQCVRGWLNCCPVLLPVTYKTRLIY